jgi:hypothetical protein
MTLRYLFERERQREQLIEQTRSQVSQGYRDAFRQLAKLDEEEWKTSAQRVYASLLPLDAPADLLPFGYELGSRGSLDEQVRMALAKRWQIDDISPFPRGISMVGRIFRQVDAYGPSIIYFDRSGGIYVNFAAKNFGYPPVQENSIVKSRVAASLWAVTLQIAGLTCQLLGERGYYGRIEARVWSTSNLNYPVTDAWEQADRGEVIFSVLDARRERSEKFGMLVNMMARTWLRQSFDVIGWIEENPADFA